MPVRLCRGWHCGELKAGTMGLTGQTHRKRGQGAPRAEEQKALAACGSARGVEAQLQGRPDSGVGSATFFLPHLINFVDP